MRNLLKRLVKSEMGGEVVEYALIAGLIVVVAIATITTVGTKVLARWNSVSSSLGDSPSSSKTPNSSIAPRPVSPSAP